MSTNHSSSSTPPATNPSTTSTAPFVNSPLYCPTTPSSILLAPKGLHLVTSNTPADQPVQILLEELEDLYHHRHASDANHAADATPFTTTLTLLPHNTNPRKKEFFLRLNPTGHTPVLLDKTQGEDGEDAPVSVVGVVAQLVYLVEVQGVGEGRGRVFGGEEGTGGFGRGVAEGQREWSEVLQWLLFWYGGGAVWQGELQRVGWDSEEGVDGGDAAEVIQHLRARVLEAYAVLEHRLSGRFTNQPRLYLAGSGSQGTYSIADMGTWPYVRAWLFEKHISASDMASFPHLLVWIERLYARPAVNRGVGEKYTRHAVRTRLPDLYSNGDKKIHFFVNGVVRVEGAGLEHLRSMSEDLTRRFFGELEKYGEERTYEKYSEYAVAEGSECYELLEQQLR